MLLGRDKEKVKAPELTKEKSRASRKEEEETNAQLTKRVSLLELEKVRLEREGALQKSKLEFSELLVQLWQNRCERDMNTIAQLEQDRKNRQRLNQLATATWPASSQYSTCCATVRSALNVCEQELLDAQVQLERETRANATFDTKLVQIEAQIAHLTRQCMSNKEGGESPNDSGLSNETNRNGE